MYTFRYISILTYVFYIFLRKHKISNSMGVSQRGENGMLVARRITQRADKMLTWLKALPNGALDPWSCLKNNHNCNNLVNFEARTSRFCMVVDLDNTSIMVSLMMMVMMMMIMMMKIKMAITRSILKLWDQDFCVVEDQTSTLWVVSLMMMIINLMRMRILNHTLLFLKNPIYAKTTRIMLTPLVLMLLLVLKRRTLRH